MRSKIPLRLPSRILLSIAALTMLSGCIGGTRHVIQAAGRTGVSLGNGKYAMSDKDGGLAVGTLQGTHPPAGTLIKVPQTEQDIVDALNAAGVKMSPIMPKARTVEEIEKDIKGK